MNKKLTVNITKLKDDTRKIGIALTVGAVLAYFFDAASIADSFLVLMWGLILVVVGNIQIAEGD